MKGKQAFDVTAGKLDVCLREERSCAQKRRLMGSVREGGVFTLL